MALTLTSPSFLHDISFPPDVITNTGRHQRGKIYQSRGSPGVNRARIARFRSCWRGWWISPRKVESDVTKDVHVSYLFVEKSPQGAVIWIFFSKLIKKSGLSVVKSILIYRRPFFRYGDLCGLKCPIMNIYVYQILFSAYWNLLFNFKKVICAKLILSGVISATKMLMVASHYPGSTPLDDDYAQQWMRQ